MESHWIGLHMFNAPELSMWINVPSDFGQELSKPSPFGTLIIATTFVVALGLIITAVKLVWPKPTGTPVLRGLLIGSVEWIAMSFITGHTWLVATIGIRC